VRRRLKNGVEVVDSPDSRIFRQPQLKGKEMVGLVPLGWRIERLHLHAVRDLRSAEARFKISNIFG
jgi:hypothetical protein